MMAIHDLIRDWSSAGISLKLIPTGDEALEVISGSAPRYMRDNELSSSDAVHFASAETEARSLVTTDSDFQRLGSGALEIVHITP